MSATVTFRLTVKDGGKFQHYAQAAGPTIAAFGGELLFRGKRAEVFAGEPPLDILAVIRFPDLDAAKSWYRSPEYQALIPNRDQAADADVVVYDELPG